MHLLTTALTLLLSANPLLAQSEPCAFSRRVLTQCGDGLLFNIDPDTGEICDALDCGGGRAPPKTTIPGCPQYSGPLPSTTRYLSCWKPSAASTTSTAVTTTTAETTEGGLSVQTTLPPGDNSNGTTAGPGAGVTQTTATRPVSTNGVDGARGIGAVGAVAVVIGVVQVVMV